MTVTGSPRLGADLIAQLDYNLLDEGFQPDRLAAQSMKLLPWKCTQGHTWSATAAKRTNGRGCPFCAGRAVWPGFNDFASARPELVHEWHPTLNESSPHLVAPTSTKLAWWVCRVGHTYTMQVKRRYRGLGCTVCAGYTVLAGFNDLASQHPQLAGELLDEDPRQVLAGGHRRHRWACIEGHEWSASAKDRIGGGTGCPVCSGNRVLVGYNDLGTVAPELAKQLDEGLSGFSASEVTAGSNRRAWWRCSKGHSWNAIVSSRRIRGCPECALFGTSRIEQELFQQLAERWSDAKHRAPVHAGGRRREVDVLIESMVVVEYDGSYFHRNAAERDTRKTAALLDAGFSVLRVREQHINSLPPLALEHARLVQIAHQYGDSVADLARRITTRINDLRRSP